jgi:hypothetical protein
MIPYIMKIVLYTNMICMIPLYDTLYYDQPQKYHETPSYTPVDVGQQEQKRHVSERACSLLIYSSSDIFQRLSHGQSNRVINSSIARTLKLI